MTTTKTVAIPHSLGREQAKQRIDARIGELANQIPGGVAELKINWPEDYQMTLELVAMNQRLSAVLAIDEKDVLVTMILPPLLGMMSGVIASAVKERGGQLLGEDRERT